MWSDFLFSQLYIHRFALVIWGGGAETFPGLLTISRDFRNPALLVYETETLLFSGIKKMKEESKDREEDCNKEDDNA